MYEKLFSNGLESDYLSKMFRIFNMNFKNKYEIFDLIFFKKTTWIFSQIFFSQSDSKMDLVAHVSSLIKVKRFSTQMMLLSQDDKKIVNELCDHLKSLTNDANKKQIDSLVQTLCNWRFILFISIYISIYAKLENSSKIQNLTFFFFFLYIVIKYIILIISLPLFFLVQ